MTEKATNSSKAPVATYGSGDLSVTVLEDSTTLITVGAAEYSIPSDAAVMLAEAITDCDDLSERAAALLRCLERSDLDRPLDPAAMEQMYMEPLRAALARGKEGKP